MPFARRLSRAAAVNSIAQLTLKLASPGVPDFYQGSELWDLTLVDPDNRHVIDYTLRRQLLESLEPLVAAAQGGRPVEGGVGELAAEWTDGRIKLLVTTCGLRFRRDHAGFMARSAYLPLEVEGPLADHVVAFARHDNTGTLIAIAPRLVAGLVTGTRLASQPDTWGATQVRLPPSLHAATYTHVITGARVSVVGGGVMVGAVLRVCPAALLWSPGKAL